MSPKDTCSENRCNREALYTFGSDGYCLQHFNLLTVNEAVDEAEIAIADWVMRYETSVSEIIEALDKTKWPK